MALLGLSGSEVLALSLGRITVQSSLGEPLRAEIEVPEINTEEAASLRANVASPAAFVAAGLEYNAAMPSMRATLIRRADGRFVLSLTSERPINDPFVDMIFEVSWSSGRIVRDYTMLFDPPSLKPDAPSPTLPQTSGSVAPKVSGQGKPAPAAASGPGEPQTAPTAPKKAPAAQSVGAGKLEAAGSEQVTVKAGDSASRIASRSKASDVSLDQMLVAMMRANPDAFARGNINRLRAGAVLDMPSADQAKSIPAAEAKQMVVAQSKDFNEYRRNLATNAPKADVAAADRKSGGKLEAKVDDKKPSGATPDKLTLSKGPIQSKADEAKIAKERADKEAADRAAEITKNINELKSLGAGSSSTASVPASASSAPAIAVAAAPVAAVSAAATTPAPAPAAAASQPKPAVSAPVKATPAIAAKPVEEPGILDGLLADPLVPVTGAGLLALLAGAGLYLQRKRKKKTAHVDSSFLESRLQPDSFFGASGGQRVDTGNEGGSGASSMVYSPSQLDAADDVDPVAEADVYLAYGRDLQAEEILKEAERHNPGRLAIHTKLLEIFAKRRDVSSFQASATQAFKLSGIDTPEWARVCELGLSIDPTNPLYQPGVATLSAFGSLEPVPEQAPAFGNNTVAMSSQGEAADVGGNIDLDLDLDFSADDEPASAISDVTGGSVNVPVAPEPTVKMQADAPGVNDRLDFDISVPGELSLSTLPDISMSMDTLDLDDQGSLDMPDFQSTGTMPAEPMVETQAVRLDDGMLEFDLGTMSLDLNPPGNLGPSTTMGESPLETKMALAEEFISIGDNDGARALIEEVLAEVDGDLRDKAERALSNLS
jgi:pilus assembly protein FimV